MRTTLELPDMLFRKVKAEAALRGTSMKDLIVEIIETGFPKAGYEIQVNQSHGDWRKSGSIYSVNDVKEVFVKDNEWYRYNIIVEGKRIIVKLNDKVVNDWTEEAGRQPGKDFTRILSSGTFALQAHDPKSVVKYRNIQVKRLD